MSRLLTIIATAVISSAATSVFWLLAFNSGERSAQAAASATKPVALIAAPKAGGAAPRVDVAPSGMAIPVAGVTATALADTYTQARDGGARSHNAIDIMAPSGTPVVAAAAGTVEKMFYSQGGGGITVYVRSPDRRWMHYYAHLQEYAPGLREGMSVRRGQKLGLVGYTGNGNPDGPHLHFAVHQMADTDDFWEGRAVNPYPLLVGG